jgi:hypothetical protein
VAVVKAITNDGQIVFKTVEKRREIPTVVNAPAVFVAAGRVAPIDRNSDAMNLHYELRAVIVDKCAEQDDAHDRLAWFEQAIRQAVQNKDDWITDHADTIVESTELPAGVDEAGTVFHYIGLAITCVVSELR